MEYKRSKNLCRGHFPATVSGKEGLDMGNPFLIEDHSSVRNRDRTCTDGIFAG